MPKINLVIDAHKTLGALKFLRVEENFKYVDGKRSDTPDGLKVSVVSMSSNQEIVIKVESSIAPNLNVLDDVEFEGLEIVPYVKTAGSFSSIDYSIKAKNFKLKN